ncbi:bifunctional nuclease family protein [Amycolatopsis marina]|nr:bifunctional nuclease family protein [Amycolatopsis marina]
MLLRETVGDQRWLAISIGVPEANALVAAHERVEHPRPDTIELIGHVIEALGRRVQRVQVTALDGGVFIADLILDEDVRVSARPSDAIAVAIRAGVPIEVHEAVLDTAAVEVVIAGESDPDDLGPAASDPVQEQEIASFRDRLDEITVADFDDTPPEEPPGSKS